MFDASRIAEVLGVILRPRYLFGIWLTALLIVVAPDTWRVALGLDTIVGAYKGWIVAIFLISFLLWISILGMGIWDELRMARMHNRDAAENIEEAKKHLTGLSPQEYFFC